jgi:hypothetical protein
MWSALWPVASEMIWIFLTAMDAPKKETKAGTQPPSQKV